MSIIPLIEFYTEKGKFLYKSIIKKLYNCIKAKKGEQKISIIPDLAPHIIIGLCILKKQMRIRKYIAVFILLYFEA